MPSATRVQNFVFTKYICLPVDDDNDDDEDNVEIQLIVYLDKVMK